jgi:Uma2 family endonuclease
MTALAHHIWTEEEYLAFERTQDTKHEFYQGAVYAMVGASKNHVLIATNTSTTLNLQLRKRPCQVYQTDLRLKVTPSGLYTYPDISVVCGEPLFSDDKPDTLLNPILIVEVLSPSTEAYDRGKKFEFYRTLESLQEYVLITQDNPHIESFLRQSSGAWLFQEAVGLESSLELSSIQCTLALADVYEKVTFESEPSPSGSQNV